MTFQNQLTKKVLFANQKLMNISNFRMQIKSVKYIKHQLKGKKEVFNILNKIHKKKPKSKEKQKCAVQN